MSASRFTVNYYHHRGVFELNVYLVLLPVAVDVAGVVELLAAAAAAGASSPSFGSSPSPLSVGSGVAAGVAGFFAALLLRAWTPSDLCGSTSWVQPDVRGPVLGPAAAACAAASAAAIKTQNIILAGFRYNHCYWTILSMSKILIQV